MKNLVSKSTQSRVNKILIWLGLGFLALMLFVPLFPVTAVAEGANPNVYQLVHQFFSDVKQNFNDNMWLYAFIGALLVAAYKLIYKTPGLVKLGIKSKDEKGIKQVLLWAVILFVALVVAVPLFPVTAVAEGANPTAWQIGHAFFTDIFVHLQANYQIYGASLLVLGAAYYFLVLKNK
jgi:ABC-type sulfate transport system permease subunit